MKLQIIVGSTRPGRVTDKLAKWVANEAKNLPDSEVEIIDLAEYDMSFLDEAMSPQYNPNRKPDEVVAKFLSKLDQGDAFVLVTPEYNRSYSAVLKNALDYVAFQLRRKPVALVSHGVTGGSQAIAHLRGVLPGLQTFTTPNALYFMGRVGEVIDEKGNLNEELKSNPMGPQAAVTKLLEDLKWYSDALATARAKG
ncbi:MAG TPA: NAD(P)H-dependent oxidoreductase [Candidatus Saccharimonadales bacterium]|nr:NAD(P)H-dependent oxidoreductase [Candidatus Saccharimonadales bacterium]